MSFQFLNQDKLEHLTGATDIYKQEHEGISRIVEESTSKTPLNKTIQAFNYYCNSREGWGPISKYADFTLCFINGVFFTFANLILILFGASEIYKIKSIKSSVPKFRKGWVFHSRMILVLFQIGLSIATAIFVGAHDYKDVAFIQPVLQAVALIVGLHLHYLDYIYNQITSSNLLMYWLFSTIFSLLKVSHLTIRKDFDHYFIVSLFTAINSVLILLLTWLPSKPTLGYNALADDVSPFDVANIFSILTFSWMTPLMKKGHEQYLTEEDLPRLPHSFESSYIQSYFEKKWDKQLNKTSPSLALALLQAFGPSMLLGGFFKAVQDVLQFSQPQMLKFLIQFVTEYNDGAEQPLVKGFMIVVGMFSISVIQTAFLHQYFLKCFNVGMNLKSSLTATIYKKSLLLSNEERGNKATGDIVNLMSVDTQRLQDLTQFGSILWSGPFQIILCLVSLYQLLGNSMWVGVFIMIIMIPLNSIIMRYLKKLQKIQMKNKDERSRVISEILNNIKSLKLYGWEIPYKEKLNDVRNNKELKNLKKMGVVTAFANFQFNIAPFLVSCSTFAVFVLTQDKPLSTDIVFPALTLFNLLSFPLAVVPMAITAFVEASVAIGRLYNFLTSEELQPDAVNHLPKANKVGEVTVKVNNGTFVWQRKPEYKVALSDVNFTAKKGEIACIVGKVGSGKSALIQSILGDLYRVEGSVDIHGNVAYVAQVPWIMNGTVKDNILFGHKYDPVFYEKCVKACALTVDFAILTDGDSTLVGEKGISLSGGQKARLSLARAVYARADVYLLDDVLAAVDEHVGKHLVDHVLGPNGLLNTKTKILATNKISVLTIADSITLLSNGKITEQGTYDEVTKNSSTALYALIKEFGNMKETAPEFKEENVNVDDLISSEEASDVEITSDANSLRRASFQSLRPMRFDDDAKDTRREHREQGKVKWDIYLEYAKACNPKYVVLFIVFIVISMLLSVFGNIWLKHWSEVNSRLGYNPNVGKYLGIYFAFGVSSALATLFQTVILWVFCSIEGSKVLHSAMTNSVLRAPMQFFETTPIGRIMNRFSNDIYKIDEVLARTFSQFFANSIKVSFTIFVICYSTWQFIFIIIPVLFLYSYYQQYYLRTSRELRRLDSVTRSPIYAHFQETLGGVATIRGFAQEARFLFINQSRIDNNMSAYFPSINANRWLAVRLEFLGSIIIIGAAGLCILTLKFGAITAGMVGLSVSYSLQITQSLNWIVRMTVEVETNIVSVERVKEYSELEPEAPEFLEPKPPAHWPSKGEIIFKDYSARYRKDLGLILKKINLKINPKEKIGIVGRTGAGKSTIVTSIFRLIEAAEGEIIIDGIPIQKIGLQDLRHKLSIIPQDSQVFEGTIRGNIDPTNIYTDEEIWNALELSHLKQHVIKMNEDEDKDLGLDVRINEGGSNLSVGQRQLMCLARALLIPSSILILDEATAAVDVETDKVLQETIRKEFKNRTILTVAHRLNTIMDSDRIIVLDKGEVKEFDSPENLLKNKEGLFYSLVNAHEAS